MNLNQLWADNYIWSRYNFEQFRRQLSPSARLRDVIEWMAPYASPMPPGATASSPRLPLSRQTGAALGAHYGRMASDVITFPAKAFVGDGRLREVCLEPAPAPTSPAQAAMQPAPTARTLDERRKWLDVREALRHAHPADEGLLGPLSEGVTRTIFSASSLINALAGELWAGGVTACQRAVGGKVRFEEVLARSHVYNNPYVDFLSGSAPAPIFLARQYTQVALRFGAGFLLGAMPVQVALALSYALVPLGIWLSMVGFLEPARIAVNLIDVTIVGICAFVGAAIGLGAELGRWAGGRLAPAQGGCHNAAALEQFLATS